MSFIGFLLERLYYELAWAYDLVSWLVSLGRWDGWRRAALAYVAGERVLEVGCGTGRLLLRLAQGGWHVCGCDLSPAMLRQACRRVPRTVSLCQVRCQALPFAAASFDTVVSTFPASYISDRATWSEFERVLAPGGRVVVVYGVRVCGEALPRRLIRGLLALGRTTGTELRPAWVRDGRLAVRRLVVPVRDDQVALLIAERSDGPDAG